MLGMVNDEIAVDPIDSKTTQPMAASERDNAVMPQDYGFEQFCAVDPCSARQAAANPVVRGCHFGVPPAWEPL